MERLLQSSRQGSFESSQADMEMDFNDVFGGPPRRFSIQEMKKRCSFNAQMETEEDSAVAPRSSWSGLSEKPVFGAERKRYQGDEFFDDIFKGDEVYSSPRRTDLDSYGSTPGSRVLSPAWPLPPKAEPFGTSLPAQFSLPAKLTKATEYPAFGSGNRSPYHNKDGASNGSLSRFSSQTRQRENGSQMFHRQGSFYEKDAEGNLEDDRQSQEAVSNANQFHFSIYKWAGKGVPLLTPIMRGKSSKPRENSRLERCFSSNARVRCDETDEKLNILIDVTKPESWKISDKQNEPPDYVVVAESKHVNNVKSKVVPERPVAEETRTEIKADSRKGTVNEVLRKKETLINDADQVQGNYGKNQVAREKKKVNENMKKSDVQVEKNMKKNVKKNDVEAKVNRKKSGSKGTTKNIGDVLNQPSNSEEKLTKVGMKGKVQEFVKIFNQESNSDSKGGESRSQSSRWRGGNINIAEKETASSTNKPTDASQRVDQNLNMKEKTNRHSRTKPSTHQHSTDQNSASSFSEPMQNGTRGSVGSADDLFHGSFVVEELYDDQSKPLQKSGESDDTKALDANIQQWSHGRKGNIRSLLSTLQLALWAESGWKAVPLVDLIEASAVKRSYQKALLCLHPDKLQQKGAASHQKYIAEKVFDILQEAWDHFNSLGGI